MTHNPQENVDVNRSPSHDLAILSHHQRLHALHRRRRLARLACCAAWAYLVSAVGAWLLLYLGCDRWWWITVLGFGPRWVVLVPLVVLIPLGAIVHRKSLFVLAVAGIVAVFPIMGCNVPLARQQAGAGQRLCVLTYNIQDGAASEKDLAALIAEVHPQIVALQECPAERYLPVFDDWSVVQQGELLVAARYPILDSRVQREVNPANPWPSPLMLTCVLDAPWGKLNVCNVHLPSPHEGLEEVLDRYTIVAPSRSKKLISEIAYRDQQSQLAAAAVAKLGPNLLLLGDFNMPDDSRIFRRDWAGLANAFTNSGWGFGATRAVTRGLWRYGARIDYVLTGPGVHAASSRIGRDAGSDHLPLIAELICVPDSKP